MPRLRELTAEERSAIDTLADARPAPARRVERARSIWHTSQSQGAPVSAGPKRGSTLCVPTKARIEAFDAALPGGGAVDAIVANLSTQRATDVLLVMLAGPRWEMVVQPTGAADLDLVEPWWQVPHFMALTGRRFGRRDAIARVVGRATASRNLPRPPFVRGHRRRQVRHVALAPARRARLAEASSG